MSDQTAQSAANLMANYDAGPTKWDPVLVYGMPPEIAKAIIAVKKQIKQIGVTDDNVHAKYKYVSVDRFYQIIGPLMADAGLALLINEAQSDVRDGKSGNPWLFVRYELTWLHESGVMSTLPICRSLGLPMSGPQAYGAAQSYIEKQFLRQVFKVPTGDKDADDLAPSEDAPARGRATAQEAPRGGARVPKPYEGPSAPAAVKDEANKRWNEIADAIKQCNTVPDLAGIETMPAWHMCNSKIVEADGEATAAQAMQNLRDRIEDRKALLLDDGHGMLGGAATGSLRPF